MKQYSAFDIIGPVMIGPSSSHTAGAARLGRVARAVAGGEIKKVIFLLHGSFSKTYRGHGTDRALVAGILGMEPQDESLRDSLSIAKDKKINIEFREADLGDVHPNTVKIIITTTSDEEVCVMGSSIGGGNIIISEIDGEKLEFTGDYTTLLVKHRDIPGMISKVSSLISDGNINIAFLKVYRLSRGNIATMVFETDSPISDYIIKKISDLENVENVRVINPIVEGE